MQDFLSVEIGSAGQDGNVDRTFVRFISELLFVFGGGAGPVGIVVTGLLWWCKKDALSYCRDKQQYF